MFAYSLDCYSAPYGPIRIHLGLIIILIHVTLNALNLMVIWIKLIPHLSSKMVVF
jgi:hypothetical protein